MSFYGKLDEAEQAKLEARRKTRKRLAVISLSAIVLAGIVVAAVLGTTSALNNSNSTDNANTKSGVSASVRGVCDVTLYREACYSSLGPLVESGQTIKPEDLFRLSVQVALDEVSKASDEYFNGGDEGVSKDLIGDNMTKEALVNCKDLLGLAVDHLNSSLSSAQNSSLLKVFCRSSNAVECLGTYQQTCIDGFGEAKETLKNTIDNYLRNSTEFTSNSLAILTSINKAASTLNLQRRRLLTLPSHQNEAPEWLHHRDRKLLQTTDQDLRRKADIVVANDESGKYKTISEALKHVPERSDKRTAIYVKKAVYYENVMMIGDGIVRKIEEIIRKI